MLTKQRFVVDASIATKWYLRDEEYMDKATSLLLDFAQGRNYLIAPSFIQYEVANAINVARRRNRLATEVARESVEDFTSLGLHLADGIDLILSAFDFSSQLGIALYDALYLTLAENLSLPFITADKELYGYLKDKVPYMMWIGDYEDHETNSY